MRRTTHFASALGLAACLAMVSPAIAGDGTDIGQQGDGQRGTMLRVAPKPTEESADLGQRGTMLRVAPTTTDEAVDLGQRGTMLRVDPTTYRFARVQRILQLAFSRLGFLTRVW